jgi:hypothetical protein
MVDFSKLKQMSGKKSLDVLNAEVSKISTNQESKGDDRFWSPTVDKVGNGFAVIRFLPPPGEEDLPFIRYWDHGFQGPGGWYIENSLTSIGKPDPVSELNGKLWNSGTEADKEVARKQKRRLHYVSNIYVVSDPANPDNEGKVFLFKYGKKIFDKLSEAMNPQFADEEAVNPFDFWTGANFKLKIRNVEGYRNYDRSEFDKIGRLFADDSKMEEVWKKEHSLKAFLDVSNFKSYEELKARLAKVLAEDGPASRNSASRRAEEEELPWTPEPRLNSEPAPKLAMAGGDDEEDDTLDYFKKLARE